VRWLRVVMRGFWRCCCYECDEGEEGEEMHCEG
jgi:hypothetical protein